MALESLQKLYNGVTSQRIDIGDFDTFKTKMQNPESRRSFYDQVSGLGIDIGDYESFELKVSSPAPAISVSELFVDPDQPKQQQPQESNLDRIIRSLEEGKNNPQYIMKTASQPDAVDRLTKSVSPLPKFVMGIPTSEIPIEQLASIDPAESL